MNRALTAVVLAAVLGLGLGAASAGAAPTPTPNVTAYTLSGSVLPADPILHRGDAVRIAVTGFMPSVVVTIRVVGVRHIVKQRADGQGVLSYVYTLSRTIPNGDYLLTFVGEGSAPGTYPTDVPTGPGDVQGYQVAVPNAGLFPFRVRDPGPPSTSPVASVSATNTGRGVGGSGVGGLPNTGANVLTPLLIGLITLAAGAVAVRLGLKRNRYG